MTPLAMALGKMPPDYLAQKQIGLAWLPCTSLYWRKLAMGFGKDTIKILLKVVNGLFNFAYGPTIPRHDYALAFCAVRTQCYVRVCSVGMRLGT